MSTQTHVSRATLNNVVEQGDALINFTSETIANTVSGVSFAADGTATLRPHAAYPVSAAAAEDVVPLMKTGIRRLIVVSDGGPAVAEFVAQLKSAGVVHMVCRLEEACDADAFMDEADSEAVAERLRQLGYI